MIPLLAQGQWVLFIVILVALVVSLSFHEFGHAFVALRFGDDTARRAGRLTINPLAHIDPMGLLMVVFIGFGYAKPVPTDPRRFTSRYADLLVAAAGPAMNLLLAIISINAYLILLDWGWVDLSSPGPRLFFIYLAQINLLLMMFNLLPIGALDFGDQGFDYIDTLLDDTVPPAFSPVMLLNRVLVLVFNFVQGGKNGVCVARAQQFAEKLVMAFKRTAFILNAMGESDGVQHRFVQRDSRQVID